jgi:hypothetical protein
MIGERRWSNGEQQETAQLAHRHNIRPRSLRDQKPLAWPCPFKIALGLMWIPVSLARRMPDLSISGAGTEPIPGNTSRD